MPNFNLIKAMRYKRVQIAIGTTMMTIVSQPGPQKNMATKKPHPFQNGVS